MSMYLRLSLAERDRVASMAVANYNNSDNKMQAEWDQDPDTMEGGSNTPGAHHPFEGEYAQEIVRHVLEREYGHRKAFKGGWGVGSKVEADIVQRAIRFRKELVALNICRERAMSPKHPQYKPFLPKK